VLVGGAGLLAGGLLAACGGDDDPGADGTTTTGAGGTSLVAFFDANSTIVAGSEQRLTFGVGNRDGALIKNSPTSLRMEVRDAAGKVVGRPQQVDRHDQGLPRGYYPLRFSPPAPGAYEVRTELGGRAATASFQAGTLNDVRVPGPGASMPDLHTPTTADPRDVDPICTREPACPLHAVDLADARTTGKPIALLVATPAYCQVAICGPVLDVLLDAAKPFGEDLIGIHVEVYRSAKEFEADPGKARLAPALDGLNLTFEPCLFVIGADGRIVKRLDTIFDAVELRQELTAVIG
jgi:hypothetical protein